MIVSLSSIGLPGLNGFIGEFLILLGAFKSEVLGSWWYVVFAATGVIFAAVYLLWMYQRVVFGEVKNPVLKEQLTDLNQREMIVLIPILIFIVWIGVYPSTFLHMTQSSVDSLLNQIAEYVPLIK
jgi:NADH-quinone oxidoreductase subunit M